MNVLAGHLLPVRFPTHKLGFRIEHAPAVAPLTNLMELSTALAQRGSCFFIGTFKCDNRGKSMT
jgi:hypothetical protein